MLTAALLLTLVVPPPPPSPPPPPPSVEPAPEVAPAPAADAPVVAPKVTSTKARLLDPPSYAAPVLLTTFGSFGTIVGLGMLIWGASNLGVPFTGLGPALGVAMGAVFLVTGIVLGAIGVFGIMLTMAEKREYRLKLLDQEPPASAVHSPPQQRHWIVLARF